MKRRHTTPSYYARNAAMQAQRRFLRTGKTEAERLDDHREATANVLVLCILAAIYDKYGIGEMRLQRVVDCANEISAKYALEKQVRGEERAKATLVAAVWWFMPSFAVQFDGKGFGVGDRVGLFVGQAGIAAQGFVLAVVGIGGLAIIKGVLFLLQAVLEQFAGVGVCQVYRAGAHAADFVKDSVNLLVLLPKRFAAGVLLLLFVYREVAAAANEDGGAGRFVAVIGVVVVGKAAGIAVKQGVQFVVIVGADLGFSCLYQRGGLVHGGAVFFRSAAGAVVAHRINIVRTAGGLFVDFVVLHFVCLLFCVLGNGDGPLYNWPGVALFRWGLPCGLMPGGGAHCAGRAGPVFVVISCP